MTCHCRRQDGELKASFDSYEAAMEAVQDPSKIAYQCTRGNWHHATKVTRAMKKAMRTPRGFIKPSRWRKRR